MRNKILLAAIFLGCSGVMAAADNAADSAAPVPPPAHNRQGQSEKKMRGLEQFLAQFEPAEQARLKELEQKDPKAFHKALFEIFEARRKKEVSEILKLRSDYLNAKDDAEKEKIKAQIKEKISADYHRHLQGAERRLKEMEARLADYQKRLDQFKAEYTKRKEGADAEIEKAFLRITDPDKVPDFPPPPPPPSRRQKDARAVPQDAERMPPPPPPER